MNYLADCFDRLMMVVCAFVLIAAWLGPTMYLFHTGKDAAGGAWFAVFPLAVLILVDF